jgi:hypothetical protein
MEAHQSASTHAHEGVRNFVYGALHEERLCPADGKH